MVIWETEAGRTVTTGTTHNLSYTPTAGPKICKATVRGGLRAVNGVECISDAITGIKNLQRTNVSILKLSINAALSLDIGMLAGKIMSELTFDSPTSIYGQLDNIVFNGVLSSSANTLISLDLAKFQSTPLYVYLSGVVGVTGALTSVPATVRVFRVNGCINIVSASIAHMATITAIWIYSMGWSTAQNTDVLLSAWGARAAYTYASGIQLRISAPTGTPGTEPPAEGESNSDWGWNAETSRHDPLTGYAAISDLQNDFYSEGFNGWAITIV